MASTYLSIVNDVLVRLRESKVTTVAQTPYSLLIGALVNDAKREVEDAWQWSSLQDSITFPTITGTYMYDISNTNTDVRGSPAQDRTRLWMDPTTSKPYLINSTPNFEFNLEYEPTLTDYSIKTSIVNQGVKDIPKYWQVFNQPNPSTQGQWNKQIQLFAPPDGVYTMKLFLVNPQADLADDTDFVLTPKAPIVLKAYLFALFERGEELGEQLTLTQDKLEQSLSDAIEYDQNTSASYMALTVPYGANY